MPPSVRFWSGIWADEQRLLVLGEAAGCWGGFSVTRQNQKCFIYFKNQLYDLEFFKGLCSRILTNWKAFFPLPPLIEQRGVACVALDNWNVFLVLVDTNGLQRVAAVQLEPTTTVIQ